MRAYLRNACFALVCAAVLCSALANRLAMKAGLIPVVSNSYLEGREYEHFPTLDPSTMANGEFQSQFEAFAADAIPFRDDAMLLNAAVQRAAIAGSAALFGYPAYPTFYGSSYSYIPAYDALTSTIETTSDQAERYEKVRNDINAFALRHPDVRTFVLEVDRPGTSDANPTFDLVSEPFGTQSVHELLLDQLDGSVTLVGHSIDTAEELFSTFYRTDHHMQTPAAYAAYVEMLQAMRPDAAPIQVVKEKTFPDPFLGSSARAGLCETREPDHISDVYVDLSGVGIWLNGEAADVDAVDSWDRYESGNGAAERFGGLYADYYHGDYAVLEFVNPAAQTQDGLMILASSHTNCLERFFTANYGYVCKIDGRHTDLKADEALAMHPEITDVLIIGHDATGVLSTLEAAS